PVAREVLHPCDAAEGPARPKAECPAEKKECHLDTDREAAGEGKSRSRSIGTARPSTGCSSKQSASKRYSCANRACLRSTAARRWQTAGQCTAPGRQKRSGLRSRADALTRQQHRLRERTARFPQPKRS